jgi:hypothetical protein
VGSLLEQPRFVVVTGLVWVALSFGVLVRWGLKPSPHGRNRAALSAAAAGLLSLVAYLVYFTWAPLVVAPAALLLARAGLRTSDENGDRRYAVAGATLGTLSLAYWAFCIAFMLVTGEFRSRVHARRAHPRPQAAAHEDNAPPLHAPRRVEPATSEAERVETMSDLLERRVGAVCGATYVIVLVAAGSLGEPQPALSLELLSLTLFLPFAAVLSSVLSGAGPRSWLTSTVLAAAIVDTSVKLASIGTGYAALDLPDGPLRQALTDANDASFIITMTPPPALRCRPIQHPANPGTPALAGMDRPHHRRDTARERDRHRYCRRPRVPAVPALDTRPEPDTPDLPIRQDGNPVR